MAVGGLAGQAGLLEAETKELLITLMQAGAKRGHATLGRRSHKAQKATVAQ